MEKRKSSEQWYKEVTDFIIHNPTGWDKTNFERSWQEPITKEEFYIRVSNSTCVARPKNESN